MRILRIVYDWPPPWGGLAPHPYEITRSQAQMGHRIDVFCGRWPRSGKIELIQGVALHPFFREPLPNTMFFTTAVQMFFKYLSWIGRNDIDLIHVHGHFGIWVYYHRKFLQRFRKNSPILSIPLVAHFHNTVEGRKRKLEEANSPIKPLSKFIGWPMARFSDKLATEVADALVFVSEETKKEAIEFYGADETKCFVVETGVNTSTFSPVALHEREKTRKDLQLENVDKIILNHGLMVPRKNIHLLVESLKYLPNEYKLFLAGPFVDKDYTYAIDELIRTLKLKHRVILSGYTPYPEIPIAYQASDIFVLPSSFEGLPKVVMQGLACNVPCLVSGFKVSTEIRGLYYIKELTAQGIAKDILEVVNSHDSVNVEVVNSLYSWTERVKELEVVYKFVMDSYGYEYK